MVFILRKEHQHSFMLILLKKILHHEGCERKMKWHNPLVDNKTY
jgi:ribosomal protein L19